MLHRAGRMTSLVVSFWLLAAAWATSALAQGRIEVQAIWGKPFGVGQVMVELPPFVLPEALGVEGLGLSEKDGRVLYPTVHDPCGRGPSHRGRIATPFIFSR